MADSQEEWVHELYKACDRLKRKCTYDEPTSSGEQHQTVWTCRFYVDGKEYGVGTGTNKKKAKEKAAKIALTALKEDNPEMF